MHKLIASLLLSLPLAGAARADFVQFNGPGGAIPASGTGDGVWPGTLPSAPFSSSITTPNPIVQVTRVDLLGVSHARAGDLHAVLRHPDGTRHNLFVRSGFTGSGLGNVGTVSGNLGFVTAGQTPFPGSGNIGPALYNQDFGQSGTPAAPWTNGNHGIFNTPLSSVPAALAGTWTLEVYDWGSGAAGSITGWKLSATDNQPPVSLFCPGDGTLATACPCGNTGSTDRGCANSVGSGAGLSFAGSPSNDTIVFQCAGEPATALSIVLQGGTTFGTQPTFGDGVLCIAGNLKRLYAKNAVGGAVAAPTGAEPSVQTRSAQLGDPIPLGGVRFYQVYYRDPSPTFCPSGGTFNISNGLRIVWI